MNAVRFLKLRDKGGKEKKELLPGSFFSHVMLYLIVGEKRDLPNSIAEIKRVKREHSRFCLRIVNAITSFFSFTSLIA
jgi:hypothetical protein